MSTDNANSSGRIDPPSGPGGPTQQPQLAPRAPQSRVALFVILGAVCLALVGGGIFLFTSRGSSNEVAGDDVTTTQPTTFESVDLPPDQGATDTPDGNGASSGGSSSDTTSTPPSVSVAPPADVPPPAPATPPVPAAASGPATGDWIVQLESISVSADQSAIDSLLASARATVPDATLMLSDNFASLRPGFWVVHHPGPFMSGMDAANFCDSRGLAMPDDCLGRQLTSNSADLNISQCYRNERGSYTEGCNR